MQKSPHCHHTQYGLHMSADILPHTRVHGWHLPMRIARMIAHGGCRSKVFLGKVGRSCLLKMERRDQSSTAHISTNTGSGRFCTPDDPRRALHRAFQQRSPWARWTSRGLPVCIPPYENIPLPHQHHPPRLGKISCLQLVEVDATRG